MNHGGLTETKNSKLNRVGDSHATSHGTLLIIDINMGDAECGDTFAYGDKGYDAIASCHDEEEFVGLLQEKDTRTTNPEVLPTSWKSTRTSETSFAKLLLSFVLGVAACFVGQWFFPSRCSSPPVQASPPHASFSNMRGAGSQVVSQGPLRII